MASEELLPEGMPLEGLLPEGMLLEGLLTKLWSSLLSSSLSSPVLLSSCGAMKFLPSLPSFFQTTPSLGLHLNPDVPPVSFSYAASSWSWLPTSSAVGV